MITTDRAKEIARAVLAGGARGVELRKLAEWVLAEESRTCRVGHYCDRHHFVHGAEAEELRERIEAIVEDLLPDTRPRTCGWSAAYDACRDVRDKLMGVLDKVDARDSLAFLEAKEEQEHEGPYVCPGCHAVAPERCAPGCIDAEIEEERRHAEDSGDYDEREEEDDG